jgi:hypothetical protein
MWLGDREMREDGAPVTDAVGSVADLVRRAGEIPAESEYPTMDALLRRFEELEARHPELVASDQIATSRLGEPIIRYRIEGGDRSNIVVGGVHPNEPVGSWTAIRLAEALCDDAELRDALDATWHLIPTIDPDGARLNEAWFRQPHDRAAYARHFYRPARHEQIEWTFPFAHKDGFFDQVLPETIGLMRVIDETRPDLYVSLHNAETGGVYFYLSHGSHDLIESLHELTRSRGLPLDVGEPEAPWMQAFAAAVYGDGGLAAAYDYLESMGLDPRAVQGGASPGEYSKKYDTFCLVAELPLWMHPDAADTSPSDESYADLLSRTAADAQRTRTTIAAMLERARPSLTLRTPFLAAVEDYLRAAGGAYETADERALQPESQRAATVAERFSCEEVVRVIRLRNAGLLLRALEAETGTGRAPAELRRLRGEAADLLDAWSAEASADTRVTGVPIADVVGVQYGAVLAGAVYVRDRAAARIR